MSRIAYSVKNAKVALMFNLLMLGLNFFSRRIFIDHLGTDLTGLTSTVQSYIGFMNLADLGITTAIVHALYSPLFRNDRAEINEVVSLFGYLFRWVGILIGVAGAIFMALIPWIFSTNIAEGADVGMIYAAFGSFLTTTLLSYLVNYKQNLLVANQKGYVVTRVFNTANILKTLAQMALLTWAGAGYLAWLAMEVVFGVVFSLWLEAEIRREYPWLRAAVRDGRAMIRKYRSVFKNVRRVFAHRIAGEVLVQTDTIVIARLLTFSVVTFYANYVMIIQRATRLVTETLKNSYAGIGNLVAEGDKPKIKLVFWQFNALYFWLAATICFSFYHLIDPFISLWLKEGEEMLLSPAALMLLTATLFIGLIRQTVQYFLNAYGMFQDVWAAWSEAGLNLVISVWAGWHFGVAGVVAGTVVSTGIFVVIWKPWFLYRGGFCESSREYWLTTGLYILLLALSWGFVRWIGGSGWLPGTESWWGWVVNAFVRTALYAAVSGTLLWLCSPGMRALVRLWRSLAAGSLRHIAAKIRK